MAHALDYRAVPEWAMLVIHRQQEEIIRLAQELRTATGERVWCEGATTEEGVFNLSSPGSNHCGRRVRRAVRTQEGIPYLDVSTTHNPLTIQARAANSPQTRTLD